MNNSGIPVQGTNTIAAIGNAELLAAPGAAAKYFVQKVIICVSAFSATGTLSIDDGTTAFIGPLAASTSNGSTCTFDFGDRGYELGLNKAVRLVNATGNVGAMATVIARKVS